MYYNWYILCSINDIIAFFELKIVNILSDETYLNIKLHQQSTGMEELSGNLKKKRKLLQITSREKLTQ